MKQGYTRIAFLLDRSGSMKDIREAAVAAVNSFVSEQREVPGTVKMRFVQFDTEYELVFDKDLREVTQFTQADFEPRGFTALYDSQCRIIDELGAELKALPESERPEKVIVVTMTDGLNNAGRRSVRDVQKKVTHQQELYNWAFVYLGANQNAVDVGSMLGMHVNASMTFSANARGVANTMRATNHYVRSVRSVPTGQSVQGVSYTSSDREDAMADDSTPVGATSKS